jgi:hypothetical protein
MQHHTNRWQITAGVITIIVMLLGAGSRILSWLQNRPLWLDEQLISLNLRERDYAGLAGALGYDQSAPLGWLWVQRFMLVTFGEGELVLRFVPMLAGTGTVFLAWLVGRKFLGPVGGFTLTALAAVSVGLLDYSAQVKHYSLDTFFTLALAGLALWVLQQPGALRRWVSWWLIAAAGSLLSMGAFIVVPGMFLVLITVLWRQEGWKRALRAWSIGMIWLAAFATNYFLAVAASGTGSDYMTAFWSRGFPPEEGGLTSYAVWLAKRFGNLSENPLFLGVGIGDGSRFWHLLMGGPFWVLVLTGVIVAYRRRPALGYLIAAPIITAVLLASLRFVPLMARLSLWLVPLLFLAIAFAMDGASRVLTQRSRPLALPAQRISPPVVSLDAVKTPSRSIAVPIDPVTVSSPGMTAQALESPPWKASPDVPATARSDGNSAGGPGWRGWARKAVAAGALLFLLALIPYGRTAAGWAQGQPDHDDRAGIAWVRSVHQPGDVVLVMGTAGQAVAWYAPGGVLQPWRTVLSTSDRACPGTLAEATRGYQRVIAYAGARITPWERTPEAVATELKMLGRVTQTQKFTGTSIGYVVDLTSPPDSAAGPNGDCVYLA